LYLSRALAALSYFFESLGVPTEDNSD